MFIGYNLARRSGLPKKEILPGAMFVRPLRIHILRLMVPIFMASGASISPSLNRLQFTI